VSAPISVPPPAAVAAASVYAGTINQPPTPRPTPALRIPVEFTAPDSGVAELTWGQMEIWLAMTRQGWLRLGGTKRLPPGTAVAEIVDELCYLMTRYPSMRTLLRFDENGRPTQEVFGTGRIALEVYDADGDELDAADRTAEVVDEHYLTAPRDFAGEWPVRMAVVRRHGELTHMVVQMCHLVTDVGGARVMHPEVAARETAPVPSPHQLDLARWQCSAAGQRHHATTARHWEQLLRSLPPCPPPTHPDPREPRHWAGQFDSRALYLAVPVIAERTGIDSSAVYLALYAIALGRTGVLNPAVIRPLVHNRFHAGVPDTVGNFVQSGICVLDVAGISVDDAVRRAGRGAFSAYKYAYFDAEKMAALFERVAMERGPHLGVTNFFNDRRTERARRPAVEPVTARGLREAASAGAFHWFERKDNPFEPLFLHIMDDQETISLQICADTHRVPPSDIEALLRTVEAVAVEAALDPAAATRVTSTAAHV
jgi:Condensation domain